MHDTILFVGGTIAGYAISHSILLVRYLRSIKRTTYCWHARAKDVAEGPIEKRCGDCGSVYIHGWFPHHEDDVQPWEP